MGGYMSVHKFALFSFSLAMVCLGSFPFTFGFFNKHFLLTFLVDQNHKLACSLLYSAAITGVYYTIRTIYALYAGSYKSHLNCTNTSADADAVESGGVVSLGADLIKIVDGSGGKHDTSNRPSSTVLLAVLLGYFFFICFIAFAAAYVAFFNCIDLVFFFKTHNTFGNLFFITYLSCVTLYFRNRIVVCAVPLTVTILLVFHVFFM